MNNAQNTLHLNSVKVTGRLVDGFVPCPDAGRVKLYKGLLAVERLSGTVDYLPVVVNEKLAEKLPDLSNKTVEILGQISTCNQMINGKYRLIIDLYAHSVNVVSEGPHGNEVVLRGTVCKVPSYRTTPFGREICDVMLAVNRPNGRSAYIPCVFWGSYAKTLRDVNVGETLEVRGRFQSRTYEKKYEDGSVELRVAYEVSVAKVVMEDE